MASVLPPSGQQVELAYQDLAVTVTAVGASVRSFTAAGRDLVDGYDIGAMADGARGQTLIPWPNRVRDGKWEWDGTSYQLSLSEPEQHNAIHGLVRWLGWTVLESSRESAVLGCTSWPQIGYPWTLDVTVRYELGEHGLVVTQQITNRATTRVPVAAGAHPYLTVGTPTIDTAILHIPADSWIDTDSQQIPTGTFPVERTPYDFRTPRAIGDTKIDYTMTALHRDDQGRFTLRLQHPDEGRAVDLWVDGNYPYVEVFTGDALPDAGRRRQGLGVEPMTGPPNALATGESLIVLEPDETWQGQWGINPAQ